MNNKLRLFLCKIIFKYNNAKLSFDENVVIRRYPHYHKKWKKIDRKKDKSLSANYFRLWVYLRENDRLQKKFKLEV